MSLGYPIPAAAAALTIERHHVVEASAGTGKTFLIEHRVVDLLLRGGAALDEILIVTFTDKAATDLRRRIRGLLARLLSGAGALALDEGRPMWRLDDAARATLARALREFDRAAISTIHGFCQRVLGEAAFDGGRPFAREQVASEPAFRAAFRAALRDELAVRPEHAALLEAWRRSGGSYELLVERLFRASQQRAAPAERLDRAALTAALDRVAAAGAAIGNLDVAVYPVKNGQTRKAVRARLCGAIELGRRHRAGEDLLHLLEPLLALDAGYLADRGGELTGPAGELRAALIDAAGVAVPLVSAVIAGLLPAVEARLAAGKQRRGTFDFDDMLDDLWAALDGEGGGELAARLRARHRFALIDEFQDTDPVQWRIFRRLYLEGGGAWLTVVGDPKQAIYGFRGADLHTYLAACRELSEAGAGVTRLDTNYRSTAAMVEAVAAVLGDDFFSEGLACPSVAAGTARRLLAADGAPLPAVVLHRGADRRGAMVAAIAREAAALLAAPPLLVDGEARRPLTAGDVFVLTRTVQESRAVAEALRERGIPCALYRQEGLFQTAEAREVLDVLAAVAAPRDHRLRRRALATRFFDVPLIELGALDEDGDDHPYVARLLGWKQLADRRAYDELFARILDESRVVERELFVAASERALTNVLHVFEALLERTLDRRPDLGELCAELSAAVADPADAFADERNVQRRETDRDAIQIMTIHRSKGLEAAVVFVHAGLRSQPQPPYVFHRDGERRRSERASGPDGEAIRREALGEDERLYYVALTRAIGQLHLGLPDEEAKVDAGRGAYHVVAARLHRLLERPALTCVRDGDPAALAAGGDPLAGWTPPAALLAAPPAPEPARGRRARFVTSYSRIVAGEERVTELADEGDAPDPLDAVDVAPDDLGLPPGRATGIYLHELLEHVDLDGVRAAGDLDAWRARPEVEALFDRVMRRHARPPGERAPSQAVVWRALTTPIALGDDALPGLAWVARSAREVEFRFPLPTPGAAGGAVAHIKGVVDLLFEHAGKLWWLDWKSDLLPSYAEDAIATHVAREYAVQAELYGLAVARMVGASDPESHAARLGGSIYLFLRGGVAHVARPGWAEVAAAGRALAGRLT